MRINDFPTGLVSAFVLVEQSGSIDNRTLVVRDTQSRQCYQLSFESAQSQAIFRSESIGPSVILGLSTTEMVAFHLTTGEIFKTAPPPSAL